MEEQRQQKSLYIRNFIFGVEDSLVSTVGLLSGIAASSLPRSAIILTGLIYITVEAFSMAVGSFLSEESAEEYLHGEGGSSSKSIQGGLIMFFSFIVAGLAPLLPYFFLVGSSALYTSILFSLVILFLLGFVSGRTSTRSVVNRGLKMVILGGLAIVIGIVVGKFLNITQFP